MEKPKTSRRGKNSSKSSLSALKGHIRAALRTVFTRYYEPRKAVLAEARRIKVKFNKDGSESVKPDVYYICNDCGYEYKAVHIAVDHIDPVGVTPEYPQGDWLTWMQRLFCPAENLQVLCSTCHQRKTNHERRNLSKIRR